MKIARFLLDGAYEYGIVDDDRVTVVEPDIFDGVSKTDRTASLDEVTLAAPVSPTKVVCVGQNFLAHIKEIGLNVPEEPVIFFKPPSGIIGPEAAIIRPPKATRVDYEGELGVVIGKQAKDVPEAEALDYVFGYTCFNDVTERDMVFKDMSYLSLAKGFDTFGCVGPWIETEADPLNLQVTTRLNGQAVQDDNTANCVFSVPVIIEYITSFMTLEPGDIVICGTPFGVQPMVDGDVCEVEISGVGVLSNPVKDAA